MREPDSLHTVDDFWDLVALNPKGRFEYIRGVVRSLQILNMGAINNHEIIVPNIITAVKNKLREKKKPCRVYGSNAYFFLSEQEGDEVFLSPDLSVSCDPEDHKRGKGILHPSLVVEVLSKGTAQGDRTWKKDEYLACPSIQAYLIVDPDHPLVTVYQRQENGDFQEAAYRDHDVISLPHVDIAITMDDIYSDVF